MNIYIYTYGLSFIIYIYILKLSYGPSFWIAIDGADLRSHCNDSATNVLVFLCW